MGYAPRILLVEDEHSVRTLFDDVLSQDGYYVTGVSTAREAVAALRDREFELVIMDFSLPDGDGMEMLRQLHDEIPHLKILATSGFMVGDMASLAMAAGAAGTLPKPTTARTLRETVFQILDPTCLWSGRGEG